MENYVVDVKDLTIRFNLSNERVDNLKEYAIKLAKRELMFQEFLALKDVSLKVKGGLGAGRDQRFGKVHLAEDHQRHPEALPGNGKDQRKDRPSH